MRLAVALYAVLLRGLPRGWVDAYGPDARSDFQDMLTEADRLKGRTVTGCAVMGLWDLLQRIPREHWGELRASVVPEQSSVSVRRQHCSPTRTGILRSTAARSWSRWAMSARSYSTITWRIEAKIHWPFPGCVWASRRVGHASQRSLRVHTRPSMQLVRR